MKPFLIAAGIVSFSLVAGVSPGHASCRVTARPKWKFRGVFAGGSSAPVPAVVVRAAAAVALGSAPVTGSVRVLAGNEVRALVRMGRPGPGCPRIRNHRRARAHHGAPRRGSRLLRRHCPQHCSDFDVGGPGGLRRRRSHPTRRLSEFSPPAWDPALRSWHVRRCVHPADCVPFLVRLRGRDPGVGAEAGAAKLASA